jgi:signal transduction histidine kinase
MLLACFFGTVLFFVLSSVAANYRERGIIRSAKNITDVGLPAIQHLASARAALRQVEVLLDDLTGGVTSERRPEELLAELDRSRLLMNYEWQAYKALPVYAGERELQGNASGALQSVKASFDEALFQLQRGDEERARNIRNMRAAPALERLDAALHALVDLNAVRAGERSESISALRRDGRVVGISLHVLSAVFATVAGVLLVRVLGRFTQTTNLRVSELEHFAGRVAHDIRSPLSSVGMALELSKKDAHVEDKTRSRLDRASRTVQRTGQLVDGLLVFAVGGAPPLEGARADIQEVLSGVLEEMLPRAQEQDIDLHAEEVDKCSVACSPGVLTSLLANLIGNAVKYIGDASVRRVTVRAYCVGRMIRVEVRDTGPGVPPELRQRIFDPYVRAATSGVGGLGLGLATVRRLVEAHGGSAGVEGNSEGGSLFWFELPKTNLQRAVS